MQRITDLPVWHGENFKTGGIFQKRVVIVGESTHAKPGVDTSQYNVLMATDHMNGYRDRFRTKLVRAFRGSDDESDHEIWEFWQSVAYFNYITVPLAGPRRSPTTAMWAGAHANLSAHLNDLCPDILVTLGYRMWSEWNAAPPCPRSPGPFIEGAGRAETYWFMPPGARCRVLAYCMKHPSSGFSWRKEHPFLMSALALAARIT
jgi:hypothetical protein